MAYKDPAAQSRYRKLWHKKNYGRIRAEHIKKVAQRRKKMRIWVTEYKTRKGCALCGERHPACLTFHHREQDEKEQYISKAIELGWGKARILKEISKCDVLCFNCHMKIHYAPII